MNTPNHATLRQNSESDTGGERPAGVQPQVQQWVRGPQGVSNEVARASPTPANSGIRVASESGLPVLSACAKCKHDRRDPDG